MLSLIKEQTRHYLIFFELKTNIKTEESKKKNLRNDLEKLQREAYKIGSYLDTLKWKIKRAEFILSCEKKRHNYFYYIIKTAEDKLVKEDLFQQDKSYGPNLNDYRAELERKKSQLNIQLEELKKNWNFDVIHVNNSNTSNKSVNVYENENTIVEKDVTLIFRYTHDTSKHLEETLNSFLLMFTAIPIIIVSDTTVPREIVYNFLNFSNVKNIPLKLDLMNLIDRNVANHIKTKYVLLAPTYIASLLPNEILNLIKLLQHSKKPFIALPVEKKTFKCLKLKLNLLQWSIQYQLNEYGPYCDSIKGDHGIFMYTKMLYRIGEPFMLPFPEAFYIQTTSLNMTVKPIYNILLRNNYKDIKKNDLLQKYQIQKQIMSKQFKIKKVIRENGIVEWYGCTRKTQRCFPNVVNSVPDYLNQGRWTPPCCLRVLKETVHHVFKVLKDWNVTFWLEGGSLLGAMRIKDIIPWDYDVDVGVYLEDINKCPWLRLVNQGSFKKKQISSVVDNEGFVWEKARPEEGDFYRVQASVHNRLHVDIFPFSSKNGIMTKKTWFADHPQDMEFPEHYLKPLTTIEFAGINAPAPNNVKEFLELKFGEGCVENPQYPNSKLFSFPDSAKHLVVNETVNYDVNLNFF